MKTRTNFDRAAVLEKLAAVLNPEAAAVQAVVEYLAALRQWRCQTAPDDDKGQPTAADAP